jgi:hypothetical protein
MYRLISKLLVFGFVALATPLAVYANAVLQTMSGDVKVGTSLQTLVPARENQRLASGTTVTTGPNSQVLMRFDDGQSVLLNQNTEFRIVDFRYTEATAEQGRSIFDILKGAARFVSGVIARRNPTSWQLRAPQATIGIRGTDFMVAIVNPLYLNVLQGTIAVSNSAATVPFAAGAIGQVTSATALATAIPVSALPAAASSAFTTMSQVTIAAAGGAATGAPGTATGAAGGVGAGTAIAVGAAAAAAAAALGDDDGTTSHTTTTTHH